jgi:nitric oxide reductase NorD protein
VLQRERHGTLLVTVERQLDLTLRGLWQDHAPLLSYSTGFDDSRVAHALLRRARHRPARCL